MSININKTLDLFKSSENDSLENTKGIPKNPFRMCIAGSSGCGKTTLLLNLILNHCQFHTLTIISPSIYQDKYALLKKISEIDDLIIENEKYKFNELIVEDDPRSLIGRKFNKKLTHIIIFDDLMCADEKTQKLISAFFSRGRHSNISCIYISQSFFAVPKNVRLNCDHLILFNLNTAEIRNLYSRIPSLNSENMETLKDFHKYIKEKTKNPYSYVYIDTERGICELPIY